MSKVITFSRVFPSYHPKAGQPTYFVEKMMRSFCSDDDVKNGNLDNPYFDYYCELMSDLELMGLNVNPKHHTIRSGHRWKVGDRFSPRIWSGRPYNSKMIQFAPDIQIKKVWNFEAIGIVEPFYLGVRLEGLLLHEVQCHQCFMGGTPKLQKIAENDGLEWEDFQDWFKFGESIDFHGQIICWNESIEY